MFQKVLILSAFSTLLLHACTQHSSSNEANQEKDTTEAVSTETTVPYTEAKNYFVKNTFPDGELTSAKFDTQTTFDAVLGSATTMGENGKPTPIDFSKQYVIALIGKSSNTATQLAVSGLSQTDSTLTLKYTETVGATQTYSSRPVLLLLVDKQYQGKLNVVKN